MRDGWSSRICADQSALLISDVFPVRKGGVRGDDGVCTCAEGLEVGC